MVKSFISILLKETSNGNHVLNLPNILNSTGYGSGRGYIFLFNIISIVYTLLTTNIGFIKLEGAN
jgi:hypothetical protein